MRKEVFEGWLDAIDTDEHTITIELGRIEDDFYTPILDDDGHKIHTVLSYLPKDEATINKLFNDSVSLVGVRDGTNSRFTVEL